MAPRRLLMLMLGLLLLSSLAAALVPVSNRDGLDTTSPTTGETRPEPTLPKDGRLLQESFRIGSGKRPVIDAAVGDQLSLQVSGREPVTLEIEGLGATEDVDPAAPARFDVSLLLEGEFAIREITTGRSIGTIRVSDGETDEGEQKREGEKKAGGEPDGGEKRKRRRDEGRAQQV